jgi:DNA-binding GntR family transcriptional regulator
MTMSGQQARRRPGGRVKAVPEREQSRHEPSRQSFTEIAYQEIRRQILESEMPAGFQITEQDLAERLQISRTPTREALLRLAAEGLIEIWPRHGMRVKHISVDDLREIYEILTALESKAAGLAASRKLPAETVAAMRRSIARMDEALARDDPKEWAQADERFHRLLADASGNKRLVELVDTYYGQAHRLRMITLRLRPKPSNSNRDHKAVVEAIAAHNAQAAEQIHRQHREESGRMLIALLAKHGISFL